MKANANMIPAVDLSFKQIGPGKYQKWNAAMGIKTTLTFKDGKIHVRHEQRVDDVLDANVARQNEFTNFRGMDGYVGARIPLIEHRKIMAQCGYQPGKGYDEKRFKRIVNDIDHQKFRLIPGKI